MKISVKSSPKVTCHHHHHHHHPNPHPPTLSFPISTCWQRQEGNRSFLPLEVTSTFFPQSPGCFPPPKLQLFSKPRHCSLHWPAWAFTLSQDCFSLKSLEDTSSQDLEDHAYLKRAGFLAGRERREGERDEWEILCVSTSSNNCVWTVTVPWCFQVMVHNSHSAFFPASKTVGSFFTVVHSLGPPGSTVGGGGGGGNLLTR